MDLSGELKLDEFITNRYTFDEINHALEQLEKGLHLTEGGMGGLLEGTGEKPEANASKSDFAKGTVINNFISNIKIINKRDLDE